MGFIASRKRMSGTSPERGLRLGGKVSLRGLHRDLASSYGYNEVDPGRVLAG